MLMKSAGDVKEINGEHPSEEPITLLLLRTVLTLLAALTLLTLLTLVGEMADRGIICDVRQPDVMRVAPTPMYVPLFPALHSREKQTQHSGA
jgi:hypothetical protein